MEIWELKSSSRIHQLDSHYHGVASLAFSPSGRFLISVGFRHDHQLLVWDWQQNLVMGKADLPRCRITSVAYSEDGKFFVTSGEKHLQFWSISTEPQGHIRDSFPETEMGTAVRLGNEKGTPAELVGRSAVMPSVYHSEDFVDVVCGMGSCSDLTFALTESGYLCIFDHRRTLDQYVQIKADFAFGLSITPTVLAVACSDSIVRVFNLPSKRKNKDGSDCLLEFIGSLPVPPAVGQQNVTSAKAAAVLARGSESDSVFKSLTNPVRPAAICIKLTLDCKRAVVVYGDRSLFIWDIQGLEQEKVVKYRSFLHHAGAIWDVKYLPSSDKHNLAPADTFVTISSDSTIRFWNLNPQALPSAPAGELHSPIGKGMHYRNVFSRHLLHVLYVDKPAGASGSGVVLNPCSDYTDREKSIGDLEVSNGHHYGVSSWPAKAVITKPFDPENGFPKTTLLDIGVKAIDVCAYPSSSNLADFSMDVAVGDRQGNLRVFDFRSMEESHFVPAHDAELVSLQYSPATGRVLVSGSRDKLVHVFDVRNHYRHSQVLDIHDTAITSARFSHDDAKLITCGSDGSMGFSRVKISGRSPIGVKLREELLHSTLNSENQDDRSVEISKISKTKTEHNTIYDLDVDATNRNVITVGQDKCLRVFAMRNGKPIRTYNAEGNSRDLNRVRMDPSGLYVACSGIDKIIRLYDFYSGACLARMSAHAEVITGLAFSQDCKRMISTAGDGCIMVWKLAPELTNAMQDRLNEISRARDRAMEKKVLEESRQLNLKPHQGDGNVAASHQARPPIPPPKHSKEPTFSVSPVHAVSQGSNISQSVPIEFRESVLPSWAKSNVVGTESTSAATNDVLTSNQSHQFPAPKKSKWAINAKEDLGLFGGQVQPPGLPNEATGDNGTSLGMEEPVRSSSEEHQHRTTISSQYDQAGRSSAQEDDSGSDEEGAQENKVHVQSSREQFSAHELRPTKSTQDDSPQLVKSKRVQEPEEHRETDTPGVRQSLSSTFMGAPSNRSKASGQVEDNEESLDISITEDEIAKAVKASSGQTHERRTSHETADAISRMHEKLESLSILQQSRAASSLAPSAETSSNTVATIHKVPSQHYENVAEGNDYVHKSSFEAVIEKFYRSKEEVEKALRVLVDDDTSSTIEIKSKFQRVLNSTIEDFSKDTAALSDSLHPSEKDFYQSASCSAQVGRNDLTTGAEETSAFENSQKIESMLERYSERISTMVLEKLTNRMEKSKE